MADRNRTAYKIRFAISLLILIIFIIVKRFVRLDIYQLCTNCRAKDEGTYSHSKNDFEHKSYTTSDYNKYKRENMDYRSGLIPRAHSNYDQNRRNIEDAEPHKPIKPQRESMPNEFPFTKKQPRQNSEPQMPIPSAPPLYNESSSVRAEVEAQENQELPSYEQAVNDPKYPAIETGTDNRKPLEQMQSQTDSKHDENSDQSAIYRTLYPRFSHE
ncbi:uncharacterized protein NEMAJ01_1765 [Nematocida major]|uniref:uncharacterized protein n=1 Tax=Nematocida major TaxID=1912982 RepID=UPI002007B779|nr:uncharacterized protein NEMAJ01_1765 [Nematocida major]KAH9386869.1 hypothetical protein NEMAJ01_1765 [Nematocida major]